MTELLIAATLLLQLVIIVLLFQILASRKKQSTDKLQNDINYLGREILKMEEQLKNDFFRNREEQRVNEQNLRKELTSSFSQLTEALLTRMTELSHLQKGQLDIFGKNLSIQAQSSSEKLDQIFHITEKKLKESQEQQLELSQIHRKELFTALKEFGETFKEGIQDFNQLQREKFGMLDNNQKELALKTEAGLDKMRKTVEERLTFLQDDNRRKLEEMRTTVDEKLQSTLEKRLGESFKIVSERLELVHKSLGEMQTLANGVGDLKRVLSNVKTRGVMGEYQLENILEQLLTPEQYGKNVKTKSGSNDLVEFAIKLPGKEDKNQHVWLPLDAKFPVETYQALNVAYENADTGNIEKLQKELAVTIKRFAKDIRQKYIDPPKTTDFALMFLPIEGLYAEVLRQPGLFETIQREYKVIITGPTTLSALLNSLQMGFRTLAIEKRSSEVWEVLGAVKTEFSKFGAVLEKTQKKLQEASNVIDQANVRTRAIERKLRNVEELPAEEAAHYLGEALQE
ncbi:DNA recombination protein RmuC [Xanthovirga aplysinae]|uniref:DNA recombination protein RmuC n=1 Tax=Xanthovirga aplysinae TaxID=2529853 RepID=UPI0012BD441A|nr:DNA recombination protein RmuC [Xanthovirga aplysinae]MTI30367.1 DNA recombination protein RmuC [Xanthovirga aplysinae]